MKIEKLSENQIRCTLNKSDLAARQLKISELAYGSEKAKKLFQDMMQQASYEFGFEAEDIPLMIEAIPVSADWIPVFPNFRRPTRTTIMRIMITPMRIMNPWKQLIHQQHMHCHLLMMS